MSKKKQQQPQQKNWRSIIWYVFFSFFVISIITATMSKPNEAQQIN